jgi:DNA invertase Pin-like site-specific DNA recombinase
VLVERTMAGLERARAQGKRLGRPPTSPILLSAARERVGQGLSIRAAARVIGLPERSLRRYLRLNPLPDASPGLGGKTGA